MDGILQVVLTVLAAIGLLALGWAAFDRLAAPADWGGPVYAVVPAAGDGTYLEQNVKSLLWLRGKRNSRFTIVIADDGLNPAGRAVAAALLTYATGVVVCPIDRLGEYIREK